jgi:hypothetical protein
VRVDSRQPSNQISVGTGQLLGPEHGTEAAAHEEARQDALVKAGRDQVLNDLPGRHEWISAIANPRLDLGHESGVDELLDQSPCHA